MRARRLPFPTRRLDASPLWSAATIEELAATRAVRVVDLEGPGRAQIQQLAATFHPDGPNDVAPSDYNRGDRDRDLPRGPLTLSTRPGFRGEIAA